MSATSEGAATELPASKRRRASLLWRVIAVVWGVAGVAFIGIIGLALWALTVTWGDSLGSEDAVWIAMVVGLVAAIVALAVMMWRGSVLARYLAAGLTVIVVVRWLIAFA